MTTDRAEQKGHGNVTETVRRPALSAIPITHFGKYNLIGKLGHGGMAEVFLSYVAGPAGFRKLTVIKRLHDHLLEEPGFLSMFLDEARLAARLNHPNVVQTHEVGEFDEQYFLAMEFLEGQPLDRVRKRCARRDVFPPPRIIAKIVAEALEGLSYAHELTDYDGTPLSVIHRDISPHNVFVTYNGMVKLLDFGISKATTHVSETQAGVVKGKFAYIAPEQGRGYDVDQRADLWSMGVVLWEALANRRLFKGPNDMATLNAALMGPIPSLREVGLSIPESLVRICDRALYRNPGRRYQTAQEMKEDLETYLSEEPRPTTRKEVAAFVTNLFGDVIEKHRSLIEACLLRSEDVRGMDMQSTHDVTPSGVRVANHPSATPTKTPSAVSNPGSFPGPGQAVGITPSGAAVYTPPSPGSAAEGSYAGVGPEPPTGSGAFVPNPSSVSGTPPNLASSPPGLGDITPTPGTGSGSFSGASPLPPPVAPPPVDSSSSFLVTPPVAESQAAPVTPASQFSEGAGVPQQITPEPWPAVLHGGEPVTGSGVNPLVGPQGLQSQPLTGTYPLEQKSERKPIWRVLLIAVLLLLVLGSTCFAVRLLIPGAGDPVAELGGDTTPIPAPPVHVEPPTTDEPPEIPSAPLGEAPTPPVAGEGPVPVEPEGGNPPVVEPSAGGEDPAVAAVPEPEEPATKVPRTTPRVRTPRPRVPRTDRPDPVVDPVIATGPTPRRPVEPAAEPTPLEPTPPVVEEPGGTGLLSLDTVPWSRVSLGGRSLGTTPLLRVSVPAGTHILTLHNPEAGITTTYRVTIRAGETTARRLGLE